MVGAKLAQLSIDFIQECWYKYDDDHREDEDGNPDLMIGLKTWHVTKLLSSSRDAKALNDVGWEIHRGNYESNLYQVAFPVYGY